MQLKPGTIHDLPSDLKQALNENEQAAKAWNDITALARNEWICWATSVKQQKTRQEHISRVVAQLNEGKRRPCCWPGCPHRDKSTEEPKSV